MKEVVEKIIKDRKAPLTGAKSLTGCIRDSALFLVNEQLTDQELWVRFVNQFRNGIDATNQGWRGEYWGKMMRGAAMVQETTRDEKLYEVMTATVKDMLTVQEPDGRVSSYSREGEFDSWDLWSRKYVMLGMLYYMQICRDEALKEEIVTFLRALLDYIIAHIGNEEGKKKITHASRSWYGVNSSSILEPVVWLYRLTGEKRYLDFASYIVNEGGAQGINIFELAYENKLYPYQYGVSKAYEMMSCFEGLLEYSRVTGNERYKTACVNFAKAVIDSDVSIIGSCGCTHELFDHSKVRQTDYYNGIMQETCVTVTWMKFCGQLLRLTGEALFADCMEQSFYNAYIGSLNTQHKNCDYIRQKFVEKEGNTGLVYTFLPFDSYSPLRPGKRGEKVGGSQLLPDKSYYGCCTCIGAAGVGVMAEHTLTETENGLCVEFYENGEQKVTCKGKEITVRMETQYPADGTVRLWISGAQGMTLTLRVPAWCENASVDSARFIGIREGYAELEALGNEEEITLHLPMELKAVEPIAWDEDVVYTDGSNCKPGWHSAGPVTVTHEPSDDDFIAFTRGPLTLCADSRTGKAADSVFRFVLPPVGEVSPSKEIVPGEPCLLRCELEGLDGEKISLVDYASAGRDWDTVIAAWLPTK